MKVMSAASPKDAGIVEESFFYTFLKSKGN
jgi:hypothetical protein